MKLNGVGGFFRKCPDIKLRPHKCRVSTHYVLYSSFTVCSITLTVRKLVVLNKVSSTVDIVLKLIN